MDLQGWAKRLNDLAEELTADVERGQLSQKDAEDVVKVFVFEVFARRYGLEDVCTAMHTWAHTFRPGELPDDDPWWLGRPKNG